MDNPPRWKINARAASRRCYQLAAKRRILRECGKQIVKFERRAK